MLESLTKVVLLKRLVRRPGVEPQPLSCGSERPVEQPAAKVLTGVRTGHPEFVDKH
jgi:hypothetical protein